MVAALTAIAGYVDGMVFSLVADTFVANQSGNLILIGVDLGAWRTERLLATLLSVAFYSFGAVIGATLRYRTTSDHHHPPRRVLLVATTAGLAAMAVAMVALVPVGKAAPPPAEAYPLVMIAAFTMGLLAFVIRQVRGTAVLTTAAAGALTGFVEYATRSRVVPDQDQRPQERDRAGVYALQVLAYVLSAAAAAALGLHTPVGHWAGIAPPLAFVVCAIVLLRAARTPATAAKP